MEVRTFYIGDTSQSAVFENMGWFEVCVYLVQNIRLFSIPHPAPIMNFCFKKLFLRCHNEKKLHREQLNKCDHN